MKLLSSKRSHHTISSWLQQIFLDKLKTTGKNNSSQKQISWAKVSVKMLNIIAHTWRKKRYRGVILIFQIFRWLLIHNFQICSAITLPEKCLYSEFFWSVFHRIQTEYGPEKLQIRTIRFTPNLIEDWNLWSQNLNTGKTVKNYFYVLIQTHQCFCFLLPTIASSFKLFLHCPLFSSYHFGSLTYFPYCNACCFCLTTIRLQCTLF